MAAVLRELGRLERTLLTLDWTDNPELRREAGQELSKGETRNSLARAVLIHRLGEAQHRPSSILRRAASAEEVADMVVQAASPQAPAATGAALRVDGGVIDTIA